MEDVKVHVEDAIVKDATVEDAPAEDLDMITGHIILKSVDGATVKLEKKQAFISTLIKKSLEDGAYPPSKKKSHFFF